MRTAAFYGFWLGLAALSLAALAAVTSDYLTTIVSLQEFKWSVARFTPPPGGTGQTILVLEVQNQSKISVEYKDLEVYLWLDDVTVGKTYGRFEARSIRAGEADPVTLTIEIDGANLAEAKSRGGSKVWRVSGTYKVRTPIADNDFVHRLSLDLGS
jgi:hypothetical protein